MRALQIKLLIVSFTGFLACAEPVSAPEPDVSFDVASIALSLGRDTVAVVSNNGTVAIGPVQLVVYAVRNEAGNVVPGPSVSVTPADIATLNPGATRTISLSVTVPPETPDDTYDVAIDAIQPDEGRLASIRLTFVVNTAVINADVATLTIGPYDAAPRQGDVMPFTAEARDSSGNLVPDAVVAWSAQPGSSAFLGYDGSFVGYETGDMKVVARAGAAADTVALTVTPRNLSGTFTVVGRGQVDNRWTSDLWVFGGVAYTGTWWIRGAFNGNTLYAWNVTTPSAPALVDSVQVDARVVNDVKVRSSGDLAVITHEYSNDQANGVTLLDLADPEHPTPITRFTETLSTGVHNAWIDGDYVYLVVDGSGGLRILDVRDPAHPNIAAEFYGGTSFLHDVYVRDGLAFLSHWNAGLIILDVGNGIKGGTPTSPVEVSRILTAGGQTHNAWYWPSGHYVFVGEEDFTTPGVMHVVDVQDIERPREVATFRVPGDTPHNFWLDESRAILYLAWYVKGIRALDVSGELMGELDRQGREIVGLAYDGTNTMNWAPQLHQGLIYLSDLNTGLWILRPDF